MKFYKCNICGQVVAKAIDSGADLICCNEVMGEITPKYNEEGLTEKHVPTYKIKDNKLTVTVGSVIHPSTDEHYICWVFIETNKGNQRKFIKPGEKPEVSFCLDKDEKVLAIYSYCNLHSLWMQKVEKECKPCSIKK